jgi:putative ABC transport system permease protein
MARPGESLRLAVEVLLRQPGRSALTVLGLAIGVGAFIAMMSFGQGARRSVLSQFESLGINVLKVQSTTGPTGGPPSPLTDADVKAIQRDATSVIAVLPVARRSMSASFEHAQRPTNVYGTVPRFTSLHGWTLQTGGTIDQSDVDRARKVCVMGMTPVRELFGDEDPVGRTLTLGGSLPCRVIGVLAAKGNATNGEDLDDIVVMPVTTYRNYVDSRGFYADIEVEPASPALLETARAEVSTALRRTHRLAPGDESDFKTKSPLEVIRAVDATARILSALLAGIALVSLLVGGIGIMNIQLVSVAERTGEIGIRAAIGASPRQILGQFLSEAGALSLLGVSVGILAGIGVASAVAHWMAWPRIISPVGVALGALFGLSVGVAFGYLPAHRAAKLDPIDALRQE